MQKTFDKLNFITAGMPIRTGKGSYDKAFDVLKEMNLDGMELEFVHGVRMKDEHRTFVRNLSKDFVITAHGPFYHRRWQRLHCLPRCLKTPHCASRWLPKMFFYHQPPPQ